MTKLFRSLFFAFAILSGCRSVAKSDCRREAHVDRRLGVGQAALPTTAYLLGSPGSGSLIGLVADSASGQGVPRVSVVAQQDTMRVSSNWVYTDSTGGFLLRELSPGTYWVTSSRLGFGRSKTKVSIVAGKADTIIFRAAPRAIYELCEAVITS